MHAIVPGGTNAGWRVMREKAKDWLCPVCKVWLRYYWTSCPTCNTRRQD